MTRTFADGLAVVPRAVRGAAEGGRCGGLHDVAGAALVAHSLVEGEVSPKPDAVGRGPWVSTAHNCHVGKPKEVEKHRTAMK